MVVVTAAGTAAGAPLVEAPENKLDPPNVGNAAVVLAVEAGNQNIPTQLSLTLIIHVIASYFHIFFESTSNQGAFLIIMTSIKSS